MSRSRVRRFAAAAGAVVVAAAVVAVTASTPAVGQPGGFGDVAEDAYYSVPVSTLAEFGVFVGTECQAGFCPGDPIDRKTMAVWIVRVLDGEDPEAVSESRFDDVDASGFHAPFIERMAELDVTRGCGDRAGFCPDRNVTRAEMAVFLSRAYKLPEAPDPGFVDVPADAWYAADVAKLAASEITVGCGDRSGFCPGRDTTRAQMATFLHRAEQRSEPGGAFKAVSAGSQHTCAIRSDDTLACWGNNRQRQADPPTGTFKAVAAGELHTCAIRSDDTVACWGSNTDIRGNHVGQANPPRGTYKSLTTLFSTNCAIRTDDTIACWGNNRWGLIDAPRAATRPSPPGRSSPARSAATTPSPAGGVPTGTVRPTLREAASKPSPRAGRTPARSAATTPSPAGVPTETVRPIPLRALSKPLPSAARTPARSAATTPSPAGAETPTSAAAASNGPTRRRAPSKPSTRAAATPARYAATTPSPAGVRTTPRRNPSPQQAPTRP